MLLAFFSPVLLAFSIIGFLRFLSSRDRMRFRRAWGILWMMAACSVLFPPGSGLYHQFSGNIHYHRPVWVSALYGTASGQRKTQCEKGGKDEFFPTLFGQ